ncbi:MAG: DUF5711 family protein [Hespellia sp.]|nr:DUF5711 family protein [Hespellia sp.]
MATKKNTQLHLAPPVDEEELIIKKRYRKRQQKKTMIVAAALILFIVTGTYLLLSFQQYTNVSTIKTYTNAGSDNNSYLTFASGIIRYTSDGVVFLNKSNVVLWNQPYQIQSPMIEATEKSFAIADQGGTSILVFTKDGLKGEIKTSQTIEKIALSEQGIVSAILKDSKEPKVISYDATGNILVEHDIDISATGYPIGVSMSPDGNLLGVSYLSIQNNVLTDRIIYYNFGTVGQDKANKAVMTAEYTNTIMPTMYFMNQDTSVIVGDDRFIINSGSQIPEEKKVIELKKEIKSTFHTDRYIGFVLKNTESTNYELRVYNAAGREVMSTDFSGEYSNVKIFGREVVMYEGSRACIYGLNGIQKFRGRLTLDAQDIIPVFGINKYLLINANETQIVRLVK